MASRNPLPPTSARELKPNLPALFTYSLESGQPADLFVEPESAQRFLKLHISHPYAGPPPAPDHPLVSSDGYDRVLRGNH